MKEKPVQINVAIIGIIFWPSLLAAIAYVSCFACQSMTLFHLPWLLHWISFMSWPLHQLILISTGYHASIMVLFFPVLLM